MCKKKINLFIIFQHRYLDVCLHFDSFSQKRTIRKLLAINNRILDIKYPQPKKKEVHKDFLL